MEEPLLNRARNLIADRTGLLVRELDEGLLARVVAERVSSLKLSSVEQYCQLLASDADLRHEREALAAPLTTGETYFFRDSGQQALLQNGILPELIERRKTGRALRIWSAACSTGEEAYSLAILLDELMAEPRQWNILILGTDINRHAIEKARRGVYTKWSFRGMSDERRQRYFHRHKDVWTLDERIRGCVRFQEADLLSDESYGYAGELHDMDLILCRNTFIYMTPKVVSRIVDKLTETLVDGGILVTGHGELYAHHLGQLRTRVFPESIVYQKVLSPYVPSPPVSNVEAPCSAPKKRTATVSAIRKARASAPVSIPQTTAVAAVQKKGAQEMERAWRYANQGQWAMATKACGEMIARDSLFADPHYLMALLAQERGDAAVAKSLLKKVIYLDPSFIAAYLDLGDLYAREGDDARAVRMRSVAHALLQKMPAGEVVRQYGPSTVDSILCYVEHLLSAGAE